MKRLLLFLFFPFVLFGQTIQTGRWVTGSSASRPVCSATYNAATLNQGDVYDAVDTAAASICNAGSWQSFGGSGSGDFSNPVVSNGIQHVALTGNDGNSGLSWALAKATVYAALLALPNGSTSPPTAGNGVVYVSGSSVPYGGPLAPNGGWYMFGPTDTNYTAGLSGWMRVPTAGTVTVQCVAPMVMGVHNHAAACQEYWGDHADNQHPAIWFNGFSGQAVLRGFGFNYEASGFKLGIDSGGGRATSGVQSIWLDQDFVNLGNCYSGIGAGPGVDIGGESFWINFTDGSYTGCLSQDYSITASTGLSRSSNVVTVTPTVSFSTSDIVACATCYVIIRNASDPSFNGAYIITSSNGTTFTYAQNGPNATSGGGQAFPYGAAAIGINSGAGPGAGYIYVENASVNSGGIWCQGGYNGCGVTAEHFSYEGSTTPDMSVIEALPNAGTGDGAIFAYDIQIADNTVPICGLENLGTGGDVSGINTSICGPAYAANNQNYSSISALRQGNGGSAAGNSARRSGSPVAVHYPNLAPTSPSSWSYSPMTLTANQPAPDGTTGAGEFTNTSGSQQYLYLAQTSRTPNIGDYYIYGAWIQSDTAATNPSGLTFALNYGGVGVGDYCAGRVNTAMNPSANGFTIFQPGGLSGGEWNWYSGICKIVTNPNGGYQTFYIAVPNNTSIGVYGPVMQLIPTGTITDNEAYELAYNLQSYPAGTAGQVAMMPNQQFVMGVGGNYSYTMAGSPTANRTITFPDSLGTVMLFSGTWAINQCPVATATTGVFSLQVCGSGGGSVTTTGSPAQYQTTVFSGASSITGVGPGTSGQVWVSNGPGAYPNFQSAATTVNGQSCVIGSTCTIPEQINGIPIGSQIGPNYITSTVNAVGLTATPTNPATNHIAFEITGGSYLGNAATATSLAATPTQCSGATPLATGIAASGNANCTGSGVLGGGVINDVLTANSSTTAVFSPVGIPLGNGNAVVTSCPYTVGADTGTTTVDRGTHIVFNSASACAVTMPDPSTTGMGNFYVVKISNIGAGAVTVTQGSSATFDFITGSSTGSALNAASFQLAQYQYTTCNSDNTNWYCDAVTGSGTGGGGTPCVITAHSFQYNNAGAFGCVDVLAYTPTTVTATAGTFDFSGSTLFKGRVGASLTTSANGDFGYDTTNKNWHAYANGADSYQFGGPVSGSYVNGDCVKFSVASGVITLVDNGSNCATATNISLPLTVSGTVVSGGIPYFYSTVQMSSSAVLNTNVLIKGGGVGAAPTNSSIIDNGTSVTTTDTGGYVGPLFTSNGTGAGFDAYAQGADNCVALQPANSVCWEAPASVGTSYHGLFAATPSTGIPLFTYSAPTITESILGLQGNGTKVQLAGTNSGSTGALLCNDANGNTTTSSCSTPTVAWSSLVAPTTSLAITMPVGDNTQFTYSGNTSTANLFSLIDATGNTGTGAIFEVNSVGTSTALPVQFTAQGTANGVNMTSAGLLTPIGTGGINATQVNGAAVPTSATVASTNSSKQIIAASTTGSGNVVLSTSPTLVTPILGTPTSVNLTNATNLPASALPAQYKTLTCEGGLGDGLNAITAGTYLQSTCYNGTGVTVTINAVKCFVDNSSGTSSKLTVAGATLGSIVAQFTCGNASFGASGSLVGTALTSGDYIQFTFVADGTTKQTDWVILATY